MKQHCLSFTNNLSVESFLLGAKIQYLLLNTYQLQHKTEVTEKTN